MAKFNEFNFSKETLEIINNKWFEEASNIQEWAFPILLDGEKDMLWQSQTWTWKTAAFGLPIVENLAKDKKTWNIQAVVLCPSRELAMQVWEEIKSFVGKRDINVFTIYWWQSYIKEKRQIKSWIDILVWTPGRIIDHLKNKVLDFSKIKYFVLDEADEMLNMGFIEDIEEILQNTPDNKRTILFSATMPDAIQKIAKNYMKEYEIVKVKSKTLTNESVNQYYYLVKRRDKAELLYRLLDIETSFYWIVFCRTKVEVDELTKNIKNKWYNADSIHWDINQNQREKVIWSFKKWYTKILVATDVAARGLDVNNLSHVVNFSIPENTEDYTHRIGRTGRAGKTGTAITFVDPSEKTKLNLIMKRTKSDIKEEKIPDVDYIINKQKDLLIQRVWEWIDAHQFEDNIELAKELLKLDKPEIVLSTLINFTLKEKFNKSRYWNINKVISKNEGFDNWWQVRLFVAKGKKDKMTGKTMIDFLTESSWVNPRDINDLKILNDFSFVTVLPDDAKKLIKTFSRKWDWWRPLVSKAKRK